jgi:hypothetical protein
MRLQGPNAYDWFLLAMGSWQQGEKDQARTFFDEAAAWTRKYAPKNAELLQFWREAAEMLGQPGPGAVMPQVAELPADVFAP